MQQLQLSSSLTQGKTKAGLQSLCLKAGKAVHEAAWWSMVKGEAYIHEGDKGIDALTLDGVLHRHHSSLSTSGMVH